VREIVDREKPAYTYYGLRIMYPALRINNDPKNDPNLGPGILINNKCPPVTGRDDTHANPPER
jgi:hypothetical protein